MSFLLCLFFSELLADPREVASRFVLGTALLDGNGVLLGGSGETWAANTCLRLHINEVYIGGWTGEMKILQTFWVTLGYTSLTRSVKPAHRLS